MEPPSSLRNLGPAMDEAFAGVGITSADQLRDLGADRAYAMLLDNGHRPHFISYYVLHMALQGRPWNDCRGEEKATLRRTFDALKAQRQPQPQAEIEALLDQIGTGTRRGPSEP
ncbi:MAG: TfoX/Sxy family DNA transformation protein [Shimia sp.]